LVLPALGSVALIALFPLAWTVWESLHIHDLRMPWRGQPFVGLGNYLELFGDTRFWAALGNTAIFVTGSVTLELILGMILALALNRTYRARGLLRALVFLPWAIPTVVTGLIWRFMFEGHTGAVNALLLSTGVLEEPLDWFVGAKTAWIPIILADVWKTTPFVALLLLAGLQTIDTNLYAAARIDGASAWQQFLYITLPLLKPALLVALIFRTLDAFRVFDLIFVMTGGGPGTATEPMALYTFTMLLQHLRFGLGAALSTVVFLVTFVLALIYIRVLGVNLAGSAK
jgi:ABC-type sugar transport system permease subunit